MDYDDLRPISITVTLWILPDADPAEVVSEMDFTFEHEAIKDYEFRDVNTEI